MKYQITNLTSGADLGIYEGEDQIEALEAMDRDAGASSDEACEVLGTTTEGRLKDLSIAPATARDLIAAFTNDDEASRFFNNPCEIDADGDVWIDRAGHGHWATDDQLDSLVAYLGLISDEAAEDEE